MGAFDDSEMQEIFESFLVETKELLDTLSADLMLLESAPNDMDLMNRIFRSIHTVKGTAGFMGFEQIQTITHKGEDLLNKLRKGELVVTQNIIDTLLEVQDWVTILVTRIEQKDDTPVDFSETIAKLVAILEPNNQAAVTQHATQTSAQPLIGESAVNAVVSNPNFGKGDGDFTAEEEALLQQAFAEQNAAFKANAQHNAGQETPSPNQANAVESVLSNPNFGKGDGDFTAEEEALLQQAFAQQNSTMNIAVPANAEATKAPETAMPQAASTSEFKAQPLPDKPAESKQVPDAKSGTAAQAADTTIRVDVGRVETLMNLSGELVLGRNRLQQIAERLHQHFEGTDLVRELIETTSQVDFVTSEIQTAVMRMRMVPIAKLYQKAPRIVRDISREIKKEIELVLKGEETELDRTIIEELNDPLMHMIRNACDHGIESPEEREKAGKSRKGKIILDAEQEGNNIVLRIVDDGRGMDPEKLKAKAIEKGIITSEQAQTMSDKDAFQLIFAAGFSTAQTVSNISGRGVGMDVVRTNIQRLKGMVDIDSEVGFGSTFTIKLPLTLAIIQGLLVSAGNETYALPLSSVIEVVSVDVEAIHSVNQREVVRIRENVLPIVRLSETLSTIGSQPGETLEGKYIVVVGIAQQRIGIVVDDLLGQQEIVIKSLGQYLGHIQGITGSTILGDGSVVMIIDIGEMVEMINTQNIVSV